MSLDTESTVFDYRALRLTMGIIALSLPFVVFFITLDEDPLSSISHSYWATDKYARNVFVGSLCVVGAFLFAYNGHTLRQASFSKAASIAAFLVAFNPTSENQRCDGCDIEATTIIHFTAAFILFLILICFCFFFFWMGKNGTRGAVGKKGRRSKVYITCGFIMIGAILSVPITDLIETMFSVSVPWQKLFWAEGIALVAFGVAWIVSGKSFKLIADEDELLSLLPNKTIDQNNSD